MGVMCEINLQKKAEEDFKPGNLVKGAVRYALDKDTEYTDIIISLKGQAVCRWAEGGGEYRRFYVGTEMLFIIEKSVLEKGAKDSVMVPMGDYTAPFEFKLPDKIPASYKHDNLAHSASNRIKYYVRIKFIPSSTFNRVKKFKKKINVNNNKIDPTLSEGQVIYGMQKQPTQLFKKDTNTINLKATLSKSYMKPGDKVEIIYEVENNSNISINRITTNLFECVTSVANSGRKNKLKTKFKESKSAIGAIERKTAHTCGVVVPTLESMFTIQNCKVINRSYWIHVAMKFSMPHGNELLKIPLEIGYKYDEEMGEDEVDMPEDPPGYWEIMEEEKVNLNDD